MESSRSKSKRLRYLLGGVFAVGVLLHLPPTKRLVARVVSATASRAIGGPFELGAMDYSLWRGRFEFRDVYAAPDGRVLPITLVAQRVELRLSWSGQITVALESPEITVLGRKVPTDPTKSSTPERLLPLRLARLEAHEVSFRVLDSDDKLWLELNSLEGEIHRSGSSHQGRFASPDGKLVIDDRDITVGPLEASLELRGPELRILTSRIEKGLSRVETKGAIASFEPLSGEFDIDFRTEASLLAEWRPEIDVRGTVEGSAHLRLSAQGPEGEVEFGATELIWRRLGPWAATGRVSLQRSELEVHRLTLQGYRGTVEAAGRMELVGQSQTLQATFADLDLPALGADLLERDLPLGVRANGTLSLSLNDWAPESAEGAGRLILVPEPQQRKVPLGGAIRFSVREGTARVETDKVSIPGGHMSFSFGVSSNELLDGRYSVQVDEVSELRDFAALPIDVEGAIALAGEVFGPFSDLRWKGRATSPELLLEGQPVEVQSEWELRGSRARVNSLTLRDISPGRAGTLSVEGEVPLGAESGPWDVRGAVEAVDVDVLSSFVETRLQGLTSGEFTITGPFQDPDWESRLSFIGQFQQLDAEASATFRKVLRHLFVEDLRARWSDASVEASGSYAIDTDEVEASIQARRLHLGQMPFLSERLSELEGVIASLEAELEGPRLSPRGQLRMTVEDASFRELALPDLAIAVQSDGQSAKLEAHLADGRSLMSAQAELGSPYPFEAAFSLAALPIDDVLQSGILPVAPDTRLLVDGQLVVTGSATDPASVEYQAQIEQFVGSYRGIGGGAGWPFLIEGDLRSLRIEDLNLVGSETAIFVSGRVPLIAGEAFDLRVQGDARLELLDTLLEGAELVGQASADLHLQGTLEKLQLSGDALVEEARGTFGPITASDVAADIRAEGNVVALRSFSGKLLGGEIRAEGELPLWSQDVTGPARLRFEASQLDLAALRPPAEDGSAQPRLELSVSGLFEAEEPSLSAVHGSGEVSRVQAGSGRWELSNREAAGWKLEGGRFELSTLHFKQGQTDLRVGLMADLNAGELDWEGSLQGSLDNALLNLLVGGTGDILVSGKSELDLKLKSAPEGPLLAGNGSIEGGRVLLREPPLIFSNVRGQLDFQERRVTLSGLRADAGGGTVEGSGTIDVSSEGIGPVDLELSANGVRLDYPPGLRSQQSGSFRVTGGPERFLLAGDLNLLQSYFNRSLALETELLSSASREAFRLVEEEPFTEKVQLELRAQTVEDLQVENNLGKLQASANVAISGTLASPELDGLITVRPEGKFRLGRNEYTVESGRVILRSYPSEVPELDLRIRTEVSGIDIAMQADGPADNLKTQLTSEDRPDLSRGDLASLLLTGRTLENTDFERISGQEREVVTEQLVSYLGGTVGSIAERGLGKVLPVERVTVDPARIASEVDPQARFTLGMGFTKDLFVTYSVALDDSQSRLWMVDYSLPKNLGVRGSQQEDEYTGGISHKFSLDFHRNEEEPPPVVSARRVGTIQVAGSLPGFEEESLKAVRTKAGDRFDYWKTQDDARRLRELMREQGYLGAVVDVERNALDEGTVDLVFRVEPGSRIELVWRGDDPGSKTRKKIEHEWEGRIPESFLLSESAAEVMGTLRRKGYLEAQIQTEIVDTTEGWRRVIFDVSQGERSKQLIIDFDGNEAVSDQELRTALPHHSSPELYELLFENSSRLRRTLETFYASKGYLDARIGQPIGEAAGERYRVIISIHEGLASNVATLEIRGATSIDVETLSAALSLRENEPFRFSDYRQDRSTLTSLYRRQGFVEARVKGDIERSENGLAIVFEIDEGPRAVVGDIRVVGNLATSASLIRRQLTFATGDPLRFADLAESERRLQDLGTFRSTSTRVELAEDGSRARNVVVEVEEVPDLNFSYGLRYNTEGRFEILTQLRTPNVFGGGEHAGLIVRAGSDESLFRGTFHTPYLLSRYELDTDVFYSREIEDTEFATTRAWSITFQQTKTLKKWLDLRWSYRFRRFRTVGKLDPNFPDFPVFDFTRDQGLVSTSLIEDRRDSVVRPQRGRFWNVTLQGAPAALGSEITFVKLFGQFILFVPLANDVVWASSYRLGIADAFAQVLPENDRFFAGGFDSVRGFGQDSLGPIDPLGDDRRLGGEGLAVFNQEIRLPLYRWIRWAAYFDAGNVYVNASDFDLLDLRYSGGVGLRVDLPFGLLRLDWARAFNRRPEDDSSQIWFSFGHAF